MLHPHKLPFSLSIVSIKSQARIPATSDKPKFPLDIIATKANDRNPNTAGLFDLGRLIGETSHRLNLL